VPAEADRARTVRPNRWQYFFMVVFICCLEVSGWCGFVVVSGAGFYWLVKVKDLFISASGC
jgi:hypothetical protein